MRVGEAAKRTGLSISNVRFYERKGLLTPVRDEDSNYREYSEEDILRIKKILLYRKMGISIETIHLLLEGQAQQGDVLLRQKASLEEQVANLQGAIELCSLILEKETVEDDQLDWYLNYIHSEEKKGKKFAEIAELLEDITEFTEEGMLYYRPLTMLLCRWPWAIRLVSVSVWVVILAVPVNHLVRAALGKARLSVLLLLMFGAIIGIYAWGFVRFRNIKKQNEEQASDHTSERGSV